MKKRFVAMLLAVLMLTLSALPAMAAAPRIKSVEYEGNGVVDVNFSSKNVRYKGAKVVVKDSAGKKLTAKILEKDRDDISFKVTGLKANKKYTFTISGVRVGQSGSYGKVKGSFRTPSSKKPTITKVEFDAVHNNLEIDFATKVEYKNLKVTVTDEDGDYVLAWNIEKEPDELDMDVDGIVAGRTYTVTVSGVRVKGVGQYVTVTKTFVA